MLAVLVRVGLETKRIKEATFERQRKHGPQSHTRGGRARSAKNRVNDPRPFIPVEQVFADLDAKCRRWPSRIGIVDERKEGNTQLSHSTIICRQIFDRV
jgi:hypothetical protein